MYKYYPNKLNSALARIIEYSLSDKDLTFSISNLKFKQNGVHSNFEIEDITFQASNLEGKIPLVKSNIDIKKLFLLANKSTEIEAKDIDIKVNLNKNTQNNVAINNVVISHSLITFLARKASMLNKLNINNLALSLKQDDEESKSVFLTDVSLTNSESYPNNFITLNLCYRLLNSAVYPLEFKLSNNKNNISLATNFKLLPLDVILKTVKIKTFEYLPDIVRKLSITGEFALNYDKYTQNYSYLLDIKNAFGSLDASKHINISSLAGKILINNQEVQIENFKLDIDKSTSAKIDIIYKVEESILKGSAKLLNIPISILDIIHDKVDAINILRKYLLRGNITGNIEADLNKEFFTSYSLKSSSINGKLSFDNLLLFYHDDFPLVRDIKGDLTINNYDVDFDIKNASTLHSSTTEGKVKFNWLTLPNSSLYITAVVNGPLYDLKYFIPGNTRKEIEQKGINLNSIKGVATSNIKVEVPARMDIPNTYYVETTSKNAGVGIFDNNVVLSEASVSSIFDTKSLKLNINGLINQFKSSLTYDHSFERRHPLKIHAKVLLAPTRKIDDNIQVLNGSANLNFSLAATKYGLIGYEANSNLKNVAFNIPKLGIVKPSGSNAILKLKSINETSSIFTLDGENNLKVNVAIASLPNLVRVNIRDFKFMRTNLHGRVEFRKEKMEASINGPAFDFSLIEPKNLSSGEGKSTAKLFRAYFNTVYLKNNIRLNNFETTLECSKERCNNTVLTSTINDSDTFNITTRKTSKNNTNFLVTTSNAGAILMGLGLYDKLKGGTAQLSINFPNNSLITSGSLKLEKFIATKTPFLTRIISFISLTGIINTILQRDSISFRDFTLDFDYSNGILNLSNGNATGPSFDFTVHGTVDTKLKKYKVGGYVVPSLYGISTIVKNIPVFGKIMPQLVAHYSISSNY